MADVLFSFWLATENSKGHLSESQSLTSNCSEPICVMYFCLPSSGDMWAPRDMGLTLVCSVPQYLEPPQSVPVA